MSILAPRCFFQKLATCKKSLARLHTELLVIEPKASVLTEVKLHVLDFL